MSSNSDKDSSSEGEDEDYVPDVKEDESDDGEPDFTSKDFDAEDDKVSKDEVDKIWKNFKSDVCKTETSINNVDINPQDMSTSKFQMNGKKTSEIENESVVNVENPAVSDSEAKNTITVTKVYDFAGEDVKITKVVDKNSKEAQSLLKNNIHGSLSGPFLKTKRRGGLQGILGKMEKRPKLSTLEKSKLDWQNYKDEEGIEDELKIHNKGKDGYVEKQMFLERTDHRQFEKERDLRLGKKSKR